MSSQLFKFWHNATEAGDLAFDQNEWIQAKQLRAFCPENKRVVLSLFMSAMCRGSPVSKSSPKELPGRMQWLLKR